MSTRQNIPDSDSAVLQDTGKLAVAWREFLKDVDRRSHTTAVSVTSPTNGQYLAYNSTTGLYTPTTPPTPFSITSITASLGANVALNNTGQYFTGPSIAQGTSGTWFVSGTVTVRDTTGAAAMLVRLWDGTTVVASARADTSAINFYTSISVSGVIASPANNLRIDVKDLSSTSGVILFNVTGDSKDSTISAIRIA